MVNLLKLAEVTQGPDKNPAMFLNRLTEALVQYTRLSPESRIEAATLANRFISQSALDIRKKLAKAEDGPQTPIRDLVKMAFKVYHAHKETAEASQKTRLKQKAEFQASLLNQQTQVLVAAGGGLGAPKPLSGGLLQVWPGRALGQDVPQSATSFQAVPVDIEASYTAYCDCGIAVIYFSSDHENSARCREIIASEIKQLQATRLTTRQLAQAKRQFIAQMAISTEGSENYMLGVGKSLLAHGEVDTLEEVYRKIDAVSASEILETANEVWAAPSALLYR